MLLKDLVEISKRVGSTTKKKEKASLLPWKRTTSRRSGRYLKRSDGETISPIKDRDHE
jgi:hypothetical protein